MTLGECSRGRHIEIQLVILSRAKVMNDARHLVIANECDHKLHASVDGILVYEISPDIDIWSVMSRRIDNASYSSCVC